MDATELVVTPRQEFDLDSEKAAPKNPITRGLLTLVLRKLQNF